MQQNSRQRILSKNKIANQTCFSNLKIQEREAHIPLLLLFFQLQESMYDICFLFQVRETKTPTFSEISFTREK